MATELEERLAGFPSLTAGLAHELTNPLVVILTNGQLVANALVALRDQLALDDPMRKELDHLAEAQADVVTAGERLHALAIELRSLRG